MLTLRLGSKADLEWAQGVVEREHYLHQRVNNQARPMVYVLQYGDPSTSSGCIKAGLIMAGSPHATLNKSWYGYLGQPTQWQVVDLCRIWIDPRFQSGGEFCTPAIVPGFHDRKGRWWSRLATWAISDVLSRIQRDRVSEWPPVYPHEPYHIRLVISYHDPVYHNGIIYKQMGWEPMYWVWKDKKQTVKLPIVGPNGKYGWCWPLPEPEWTWDQIAIRRPRTMRLVGMRI